MDFLAFCFNLGLNADSLSRFSLRQLPDIATNFAEVSSKELSGFVAFAEIMHM